MTRTINFCILFLVATVALFVSSCKKEAICNIVDSADYSIFRGEWRAEVSLRTSINDSIASSETLQYDLIIDNDEGEGVMLYSGFDLNIQLAYNPDLSTISIISVFPANSEGVRHLSSDHYDVIYMSEDSMFLQDIDRRATAQDRIKVTHNELSLVRK
jgi:hypothetical protein